MDLHEAKTTVRRGRGRGRGVDKSKSRGRSRGRSKSRSRGDKSVARGGAAKGAEDPCKILKKFKVCLAKNSMISNKILDRRYEFVEMLEDTQYYTDPAQYMKNEPKYEGGKPTKVLDRDQEQRCCR